LGVEKKGGGVFLGTSCSGMGKKRKTYLRTKLGGKSWKVGIFIVRISDLQGGADGKMIT